MKVIIVRESDWRESADPQPFGTLPCADGKSDAIVAALRAADPDGLFEFQIWEGNSQRSMLAAIRSTVAEYQS